MKALANRTIVSMYGKPQEGLSLSDEILYGMPVEVLELLDADGENTDNFNQTIWCHVRSHYRYEGYCRREELYFGNTVWGLAQAGKIEADFEESMMSDKDIKVIMQAYADILSEPRVQGVCLQSIIRGGRIRLIGPATDHEGWMQVALVDGRIGYTKEKFLGTLYETPFTQDEDAFRQRVVNMAKLYLGTQYRWGGKSPLGIDCSGLTSMSYMLCGVLIYRDASIEEGFPVHEIPFAEKKPGDLLYFPGHIAMYMGDNLYIHSTGKNGSDGVVINSFDPADSRYREDLPKILKCVGSIF